MKNRHTPVQSTKASKPALAPTSFLSLPAEIRQQILLHTHFIPINISTRNEANDYFFSSIFGGEAIFDFSNEPLDWIRTLRQIDPRLVDDLEFVEEEWRKQDQIARREALIATAMWRKAWDDEIPWVRKHLQKLNGQKAVERKEPGFSC